MSRQPALLGEVLSTELTADLATDAVGAKVVTKRVPVRVTFLADIADQLLSLKERVKWCNLEEKGSKVPPDV